MTLQTAKNKMKQAVSTYEAGKNLELESKFNTRLVIYNKCYNALKGYDKELFSNWVNSNNLLK